MNKHYDKYLCRAAPKEFCKVYVDHLGRGYVYIGVDKYFISKPYTSGDVEICDLSPIKKIDHSETESWLTKVSGWYILIVVLGITALAFAEILIK